MTGEALLKTIAAIAIGAVVALSATLILAAIGDAFYPLPPEVDTSDTDAVTNAFVNSPMGVKIALAICWFTGSLAGGVTARLIYGRRRVVWWVAGIMAALALWILFAIPLPAWMQVMMIAAPFMGGIAANHIAPVERRAAADAKPGEGADGKI